MSGDTYIGVIDQGTTGTRFVVVDGRGQPVADAFTRLERRTLRPDRVEYDPDELWGSTVDAIQRGLQRADLDPDALTTIGIANQRQTTVVWERSSGRPLGNALGWQDRRVVEKVAALGRDAVDLIRDRTGLVPDAYFAAPKLQWFLDEHEVVTRARATDGEILFGTVDSWLVYNLTGEHVTDVTNAAQTMLFDIHDRAWDEDLRSLFGVPRAMLPEVRPSSDPHGFGRTDPEGILGSEVPVTGVLGDQQASLVGQGGFSPGDAKVTYGSGNFFLQNTGDEAVSTDSDLLTTIWFQSAGEDPCYGLEGPIFATGSLLEWFEDIGFLEDPERITTLSHRVESSKGVVVAPGFDGLGGPSWGPGVRAALVGLSRHTRPEHLARAAVERIGFGTRATVESAERATGVEHESLIVDGGAVHDDEFARLQATLVGTPLVRSEVPQTTALGAAFAAGLASDIWDSPEEVRALCPARTRFEPANDRDDVDRQYRRWCDLVDTVRSLQRESTTF